MAETTRSRKIVSRSRLREIIRKSKSDGKKVVFTNGCFDVIGGHHVRCLEEAKNLGDILIVAMNTDESVRKIKGPRRPIVPLTERAAIVAAFECVDYVTSFREATPHKILREILPDVLVKGGDYRKREIVGREIVEANGGEVVRLKEYPDKSSTRVIDRILERYAQRTK